MAGAPGALGGSGIPPAAGGVPVWVTSTAGAVVAVVEVGAVAGVTRPICDTAPPALTPTGSMRTTVRVRPLPDR